MTPDRWAWRSADAFGVLVRTIYTRLCALFGDRPPAPEEILAADEEALRAAGLSRSKVSYLHDLAWHVIDGDLDALDALPDEEVIDWITDVKGLGRWRADMFKSITAAYADQDHLVCAGYRGALRDTRIAHKRRGGAS